MGNLGVTHHDGQLGLVIARPRALLRAHREGEGRAFASTQGQRSRAGAKDHACVSGIADCQVKGMTRARQVGQRDREGLGLPGTGWDRAEADAHRAERDRRIDRAQQVLAPGADDIHIALYPG